MSRWLALLALLVLLSGCPPKPSPPVVTPPKAPPPVVTPPEPPPTPMACDAPTLLAGMGSTQPDFSRCEVPALVAALGNDVRRGKTQCSSFIKLDADWKLRMQNWGRLLDAVIAKAQSAGGPSSPVAATAQGTRDTLAPMANSAALRDVTLDTLLINLSELEKRAGVPVEPIPKCQM